LMGINPASLTNSNMKSVLLVTSPIDGTVSDVFAKIGSYVDVSFPIAEIIENSALHLDLQVFEKDIAMIKVGQKIDFVPTNVPNKSYTAKVYNIGSSFSDSSKTIAVHCKVVGDKTGLIDGMNVTGIINLGGVLSTAVPNEAIVNSEGKYYIFLLKENLEKPHVHKEGETHEVESLTFERIEIMIGTSELGFTAIMPVNEIHNKSKIVTKGAFFVNAKLTNAGDGHEH
jgi:cobalt-zinc-cadmium efflux system membrane fusion protein